MKQTKFNKEVFDKIYDKISEIHLLGRSGNFTLKGIMDMILLLKNNLYGFKETKEETLELKPFWYNYY